jgi:hypothetical protein
LRLSVHLDLGERLEQGNHRALGLLAALGGGELEGGADLRVAKVVWLSALASVVAAGTKGVMMERSGDLPVGEAKGFGGGDGFESESAEEGGVLEHRLLVMGREGGEEGGVAFLRTLAHRVRWLVRGASSAMRGRLRRRARKRSADSIAAALA